MMKFIFLDIDGVLNHNLWYKQDSHVKRYEEMGYPKCDIDPDKLKLLDELVSETEAQIVISSTWRNNYTIEEFRKMFFELGFKNSDCITSTTLRLHFKEDCKISVPRGIEIYEWINSHVEFDDREYLRYVIFDDDSDMMYWQRNNFLLVDSYCGLTPNLIYKAKIILNS